MLSPAPATESVALSVMVSPTLGALLLTEITAWSTSDAATAAPASSMPAPQVEVVQ